MIPSRIHEKKRSSKTYIHTFIFVSPMVKYGAFLADKFLTNFAEVSKHLRFMVRTVDRSVDARLVVTKDV